MGTSLITKSLGYIHRRGALSIDISASQTYGVVPQCFHQALDHLGERYISMGLCTGWEGGELGFLQKAFRLRVPRTYMSSRTFVAIGKGPFTWPVESSLLFMLRGSELPKKGAFETLAVARQIPGSNYDL